MKVKVIVSNDYEKITKEFNEFAEEVEIVKVEVKEFEATIHNDYTGFIVYHIFYRSK